MRYERRSNKRGTDVYYSFIKYEKGKQRRLSRDEIRNRFGKDITSEEEAKKCLGMFEAEVESEKSRTNRVLEWKTKFFRYDELLKDYTRKQKKKAPNSYQNNYHYLAHYVLPFFLSEERKISNVLMWYSHFDAFRDYLVKEAKLVRSGQPLSYGSKNHAIKALNTFLRHLYQEGVIENLRQCEYFEEHLLNQRTIDDVVLKSEFEKVEAALLNDGHRLEADLYRFLYYTGMRVNEAAGVSLADVFPGEISKKAFDNRLKANDIEYYGYVLLKSQPGGMNRTIRDNRTQKVIRKPLKGRKTISEKDCRVVPITDKYLWTMMMERLRIEHDHWKSGMYGSDASDYLLFDGFNKSTSMTRLKAAYEKANIRLKTWHCLRHTRGTELFGETGDRELAKMWLGHGSNRVFERYNHTYEELVRSKKRTKLKKHEQFDDWFFGQDKKQKALFPLNVSDGWRRVLSDVKIEQSSKALLHPN